MAPSASPGPGGLFSMVSAGMRRVRDAFTVGSTAEPAGSSERGTPGAAGSIEDETMSSGGDDGGDKQQRDVYALLNCPNMVKPMIEFPVTLGLSAKPTEGVIGGTFTVPDPAIASYQLEVTLVSHGFLLRPGETNRITLDVTVDDPYPSTDVHLQAVWDDLLARDRMLIAHYSIDGQLIGSAQRRIKVRKEISEDMSEKVEHGFDFSMPPGVPTPDMTVAIVKGNAADQGTLVWYLMTPHDDIDVSIPAAESQYKSNIGDKPEDWARRLMNDVNANPDDEDLEPLLVGCGKEIREQIPVWPRQKLMELWQKLKDRSLPPTVLLVSDEPHVPWELAYLRLDRDGTREGFLGAEFVVGRWVRGYEEITGTFVPVYPPPVDISVTSMAVVTGDYSKTKNWSKLEGAEEEARELIDRYKATMVNADNKLATWLKSSPDVNLIHFAVHGNWSLGGNKDGVVLVDGTTLTPTKVRSAEFKNAPFVFLNACQLGQGDVTLGSYGGIAAAFLKAGAGGVIASLWNVDDKQAAKLALDFYEQTKTTAHGPGELLRRERSAYQQNTKSKLSLAYQFFGHPHMRMQMNTPEADN